MDPATWPVIRDLFEASLDVPAGERAAFVRAQAGGDPAVEREVLRLIGLATGSADLLQPPSGDEVLDAFDGDRLEVGDRVGRYRVEGLLGRGGMGSVHAASQERPSRKVALKVMGHSLDPDARRRFEVEAETLARLRHPGIATIHELGLHRTASGVELPYFAMELVEDARDLASYAREEGLDLPARLELFCAVCAAVNHAHRAGVIHRDLKPGNVLVDGSGQPKVIDYGVARHTGPGRLAGVETQPGHVLGTLQYASPEQLTGEAGDVDQRSDVYSLGVILYELVAGRPPYDVADRPIADALVEVCERVPPPPSARDPQVPVELDWIVAVALAKERDRRYDSAAELGDDLERLARHEPVRAGPETTAYRLRKFARRHRVSVVATLLVLASLVGGAVATGLALLEAEERRVEAEDAASRAAEEAERARRALRRQEAAFEAVTGMIAAVHPRELGRDVTLLEVLQRTQGTLAELAHEPEVRFELLFFLSGAYANLGEYERAAEVADAAMVVALDCAEPSWERRAALAERAARMHVLGGRVDEAEALLEQALADRERAGDGASAAGRVSILLLGAQILLTRGRVPEAVARLEEAVDASTESLGPEHELTLRGVGELAQTLAQLGRTDEAVELAAEAFETAVTARGEDDFATLEVGLRYVHALSLAGRPDELLDLQEWVVDGAERMYGETHSNTLVARHGLATAQLAMGDFEAAEATARAALELAREHHPDAVELRAALSNVLEDAARALGRPDDERRLLEESIAELTGSDLADHAGLIRMRLDLGRNYLAADRVDEAIGQFVDAYDLAERDYSSDHGLAFEARGLLGCALLAQGAKDDAQVELRGAIEGLAPRRAEPLVEELLELFELALARAVE